MNQTRSSFSGSSCHMRCQNKPKNPDEDCVEACGISANEPTLQKRLLFWLGGLAGVAIVIVLITLYGTDHFSPHHGKEHHNNSPIASSSGAYATPVVAQFSSGPLTANETRYILFMREEEKLARDVYQEMHRLWGISMFVSISRAEQRHMDTVGQLIQRYGLPDPAEQKAPGSFVDTHLSQMYQQLTQQGQRSVIEALRVGALIEELDILDLENAIKETDKPDIIQVYSLIHRGSFNHLRAFAHGMELQGVAYAPVKLSAQSFDTILHSPMDTGLFQNQ
ncbi:MAG: DUF2202 domain-containing protein [Magnetococcales bacterium]|nr:DUF2202 domain-containing protein [Magnetococcales bacterium]